LSGKPDLARGFEGERRYDRIYHEDGLMRLWERGRLESEDDYLAMRELLAPSFGVAFGVHEARSYQTLRTRAADAFQMRLSFAGESPLMDWAGIRLVVGLAQGASRVGLDTVRLMTRPTARPRAFIVEAGAGSVEIESYLPGDVALRVRAAGPCEIVFAEAAYPGWKATLDGRAAAPGTFEGIFLSMRVPAGEHTVRFAFRPASFAAGAALSLLTIGVVLFVV